MFNRHGNVLQLQFLLEKIYYKRPGRNINCGWARGIGKTYVLRKIIERDGTPKNPIWMLTINNNIGKIFYGDLIKERKCKIVTPRSIKKLSGLKAKVYSDEIPNAEELLMSYPNIEYMGGFYTDLSKYPKKEHIK